MYWCSRTDSWSGTWRQGIEACSYRPPPSGLQLIVCHFGKRSLRFPLQMDSGSRSTCLKRGDITSSLGASMIRDGLMYTPAWWGRNPTRSDGPLRRFGGTNAVAGTPMYPSRCSNRTSTAACSDYLSRARAPIRIYGAGEYEHGKGCCAPASPYPVLPEEWNSRLDDPCAPAIESVPCSPTLSSASCKRWKRRTTSPETITTEQKRTTCPSTIIREKLNFFIDTGIYSFVYHSSKKSYEPSPSDDVDRESRRRRKSCGASAEPVLDVFGLRGEGDCHHPTTIKFPGDRKLPSNPELGEEVSALQQYWYSESTLETLATECRSVVAELKRSRPRTKPRIALLSVPSLYFSLDRQTRLYTTIFEYDMRWQGNCRFIFFDYNHPEKLSPSLWNKFDMIIADPPFIRIDVVEKYVETIGLLGRNLKVSIQESSQQSHARETDLDRSLIASDDIDSTVTALADLSVCDTGQPGKRESDEREQSQSCRVILSTSSHLAPTVYELASLTECCYKPFLPSLALSRMKHFSFFSSYRSSCLSKHNYADFPRENGRKHRLRIEQSSKNGATHKCSISDVFGGLTLDDSGTKPKISISSLRDTDIPFSKTEDLEGSQSGDEIDWETEYASTLGKVPHDL